MQKGQATWLATLDRHGTGNSHSTFILCAAADAKIADSPAPAEAQVIDSANSIIDFVAFWPSLESLLTSVPSTGILFNQYRDCNPEVDIPNAAAVRMANLRNYLHQACSSASVLVVGEAAGPWGARFSGVPFVGEKQLLDPSFPIRGERSSLFAPLRQTRLNPPFVSLSAKLFWEVLLPYRDRIVVWDAVPFHTHKLGDALTVRNPSKKEVAQFGEMLRLVEAYVQPSRIVAVGRRAFEALEALGKSPVYVRHPSMGGKARFATGMQEAFGEKSALTVPRPGPPA